jgi:hypothetical protein
MPKDGLDTQNDVPRMMSTEKTASSIGYSTNQMRRVMLLTPMIIGVSQYYPDYSSMEL